MSEALTLQQEDFSSRYSSLLEGLAQMGWTASEAYTRAVLVYPQIDRELLVWALNSGRWTFAGQQQTNSHVLMASALWYAVACTYDFEPDYEYSAIGLDASVMEDLPRMLEVFALPADVIAGIIGRIGAALKYLHEHPYTELDEQAYDDFLGQLPPELSDLTQAGFHWPPSRAVITERLGQRSWARALLKSGICPPEADRLGVVLAASSLTDRSFRNALSAFLSYCIRSDRKPTVLLYGEWAEDPARAGQVPHLGAVRARYGSWHHALQLGRAMINDVLILGQDPALPVRPLVQDRQLVGLDIEQIQAQGIGVVRPQTLTENQQPAEAWERLVQVLEEQLEQLPWSLSLQLYYVSPQVLESGDFTSYVRILRSPAGYICELASAQDFASEAPVYRVQELAGRGWAPPTAASSWSQTFLTVGQAASTIIGTMRYGMGCDQPDYYQSDAPSDSVTGLLD